MAPKWVPNDADQEPNESRRLWSGLTKAIGEKDMEAATASKSAVEEAQREQRRKLEESNTEHKPRWFAQNKDGRWEPKIQYVRFSFFEKFNSTNHNVKLGYQMIHRLRLRWCLTGYFLR